MTDLPHLRLQRTAIPLPYASKGGRGPQYLLPARDRGPHARQLMQSVQEAAGEVEAAREVTPAIDPSMDGVSITLFSDPDHPLPLDSLDRRRDGIELLSIGHTGNGSVQANLFVSKDKVVRLLQLFQDYENEDDPKTGKPKNKQLAESISSLRRSVLVDLWQDDLLLYPMEGQRIWWEVWGRRIVDETAEQTYERLRDISLALGARVSPRFVSFPERIVTLVYATPEELGSSLDFLSASAELRKAKEVPTPYTEFPPRDQAAFVEEAAERLQPPGPDAPAVCLLDTGVNRGHPLLAPALDEADLQAVNPEWGSSDHDHSRHGTRMAGVALYRCLTDCLMDNQPIILRHRLESVKLLPPPPDANDPEVYGSVTQSAIAKAIISAPERNRAICLAVTTNDDRDHGFPSSWSAAIDQTCSGAIDGIQKLIFICTGNCDAVLEDPGYVYPQGNSQAKVQDPSQAWNAVTVGGYTELVVVRHPDYDGWNPIAPSGDLSPSSRTSRGWADEDKKGWPIKPDILMEAGNFVENGAGDRDGCHDLSLLTTVLDQTGRLLGHMRDTSAATAAAARAAAIIWSHYPRLWPETIRALLIHSARWTPAMEQRFPDGNRAAIQDRLRFYGYGVPKLHRAIYSAENFATMVIEDELQPFERRDGSTKTKEMHIHALPWPVTVLEELGNTPIEMRVTLSYFIEPSPGRRGWKSKFRYASHGLRFDVKRIQESREQFVRRISLSANEEEVDERRNVRETRNWKIGPQESTHGSVHSDWWEGTAVELAACGELAVFPVIGWWRERPHLNRLNNRTRYSLLITLATPDEQVNLYAAIAAQINVRTEIET